MFVKSRMSLFELYVVVAAVCWVLGIVFLGFFWVCLFDFWVMFVILRFLGFFRGFIVGFLGCFIVFFWLVYWKSCRVFWVVFFGS